MLGAWFSTLFVSSLRSRWMGGGRRGLMRRRSAQGADSTPKMAPGVVPPELTSAHFVRCVQTGVGKSVHEARKRADPGEPSFPSSPKSPPPPTPTHRSGTSWPSWGERLKCWLRARSLPRLPDLSLCWQNDSSKNLEHTRSAHAAANAHRHAHPLRATALAFDERMTRQALATHAIGMAHGNGATVDVQPVHRNPQRVRAIQHLDRRRLRSAPTGRCPGPSGPASSAPWAPRTPGRCPFRQARSPPPRTPGNAPAASGCAAVPASRSPPRRHPRRR